MNRTKAGVEVKKRADAEVEIGEEVGDAVEDTVVGEVATTVVMILCPRTYHLNQQKKELGSPSLAQL